MEANGRDFAVNLDWKGQAFGQAPHTISDIRIKMKFAKEKNEYFLTRLEIEGSGLGGDGEISTETTNQYTIVAPVGLSWGCSYPGIFPPRNKGQGVGLTFPDVQLQAFGLKNGGSFGPEWTCG